MALGLLHLSLIVTKASLRTQALRISNCFLHRTQRTALVIACPAQFRYFSKDLTVKQPNDVLLQKLITSENTFQLLDLIEKHHSIMNSQHLLQSLRSLFEHQKSEAKSLTKYEILKSPQFVLICKGLKSQARSIDINDTIEALKIVTFIGVPATSTIAQILLQLVRQGINDVSLQHILFLDFLLLRMDRCPLVEALLIALPLVFDIQVKTKLDRSNVSSMADMLNFASKKPVSKQTLELLINELSDSNQPIDAKTAYTIVRALCNIKESFYIEPLLKKSFVALAENLQQFTFKEVEDLMGNLVNKIKRKELHFYNDDLMEECAKYVIRNDCGFERAVWILRKLSRIAHTNIELIDYLSEKVTENPMVLKDCRPNSLLSLVTGLSNTNYRPAAWDLMQDIILTNSIITESNATLPWLKFAVELAALGSFSPPLLEKVFDEKFLRQFLSREYNLLDHLQLLTLYQAVVTLYPKYKGPFPPKDILDKAMASNGEHADEFPLQAALEQGCGGPAYVQTKVYTELGHFIDHVIVMRKGGYPVSLSLSVHNPTTRNYIEDLMVPPDSHTVVIMGFHKGCYSINCSRLRGNHILVLRTLEALGHAVVPISLIRWTALYDHEKIPYLMQCIKLKCEQQEKIEATSIQEN